MMKLSSSAIIASFLAASTAAFSSSSQSSCCSSVKELRGRMDGENSVKKDKFAPRFDGLRFIETLVTAHK